MDAQDFTDVIQVCTDGSSLSEKGVTTAVELAKTLGLPLLGMTVVKGDDIVDNTLDHTFNQGVGDTRLFD